MEEIIRYDRMGLIPSKNTKSLEGYKQESREKLSFLQEIREDPERTLYERFEKKLRVELYEPSSYLEDEFKEATLTETWPGIITDYSELRKIRYGGFKPRLLLIPIFPFLLVDYFVGSKGTVLSFGEKIRIPIITNVELPYLIEETYTHELVHGIRSQFILSLDHEVYASKIQDKVNDTNKFSAFETGAEYGTYYSLILAGNIPFLVVSFFYPLLFLTPLIGIPSTAYYFHRTNKKFEKFVEKCKNEKLNPYYLLLRSDLKEYKLNKSIRKQLEEKKGLRWDIIRSRMQEDF